MFRRTGSILFCLIAFVLLHGPWSSSSVAQTSPGPAKYDPYSDPVPTASGGPVLPDADNPADPAGMPVPKATDMPAPTPLAVPFVTTAGGHFSVDGHEFRHVGVNSGDFVYEGGPNSDLWNDTYFLRQGGIKQVRVFLANDALDTPTIIGKLDAALGVAWSRGIRLTVVFTDFYWATHSGLDSGNGHVAVRGDDTTNFYTDSYNGIRLLNLAWITGGYNQHYKPFVHDVVDHFKNDGRIFAWEIGNEIGAPQGRVEETIAFYRDMALYIKGIDPNHLVSPGIICTTWLFMTNMDQKTRLYQYMDYVTEHHYEHPRENAGDLADNQLAASFGKPLVIEEYGVPQVDPPYSNDHNLIMPTARDFFDRSYASDPVKQADAVMVWGVDFGNDLASHDGWYGPGDQGLTNDYLQLWRETADWARIAPRYSDVPPGDTFYSYIECLSRHRVVSGLYSWVNDAHNDEFHPGEPVTRGEAMKAIVRAMGWTPVYPSAATFTDVRADNPYFRYVETAVRHGIISGYPDGTFRPDANLTRGQMTKVIVLASGWPINTTGGPHFTDVPVGQTFYEYVETAYNRQIIGGYPDGTFRPNNNTTRGQFAKMLSQAISCN